jgi:hypothetical protein
MKIESDALSARAIAGLAADLRIQLAALLLDTTAEVQMHAKKISRPRRTFRAEAERRKRMLKRKREKVRAALQNWLDYARDLDPLLAGDSREIASRCIELLGEVKDYDPALIVETIDATHPVTHDPVVKGMLSLYWFLRGACGLPGDEAEVRVALLRNAFWKQYGVSEVAYRPEYVTGESQGCQAVHEAVRRFKPPPDRNL